MRTRKWPDSPHWEFEGIRLGTDDLGHWVGVPKGTLISRPGKTFSADCDHVVLLPEDDWWIATLYGEDPERPVDIYVDITTPCVWSDDERSVSAVDLDLDVIRDPDGRVWVDDEDEFADHRLTLGYPAAVVDAAVRSCAEVLAAVGSRVPPYDGSARHWLRRL